MSILNKIDFIKNITKKSNIMFYEYRPIHRVVGNNINKINGILNQDYYLNGWKEQYIFSSEIDGEKGEILIDNIKDTIDDYAQLIFLILPDNEYYIKNIINKTKIPGLGIILINELKKKLKKGKSIYLLDCAKNKKGEPYKGYYKKQNFQEGIFLTTYKKHKNNKSFINYIKKIINNFKIKAKI